jgi:undecaprenyl pyrophosphate synthase
LKIQYITEGREVFTMNQQTTDQSRQELREIIGGIFDHVLRKRKENAILSASRIEAKMEQSGIPSPDWQSRVG